MKDYWNKPVLTVQGQSVFWDAQAAGYEQAPMTVDNQPEMEAVLDRCRQIVTLKEIITLGGAVGCRDPKVILDELFFQNPSRPLPRVVFNDLSNQQVQWARENALANYANRGVQISFLPGEIKTVCNRQCHAATVVDRRLQRSKLLRGLPNQGYPLRVR